jgi:predicted nucleic acid-binding protein
MIFVDTSVWYPAYVSEDVDHSMAAALLAAPSDRLVTTDYIVDELLTLMVARGQRRVATEIGGKFLVGNFCQIVWIERDDAFAAWQILDKFDDKSWSFTDCVSYAVKKRLGIKKAFSLDDHFRQFGIVSVHP